MHPLLKKILGRLSFQSTATGKTWERSALDRAGYNGWNSPRIHTYPRVRVRVRVRVRFRVRVRVKLLFYPRST